jgi:hypothetical protein
MPNKPPAALNLPDRRSMEAANPSRSDSRPSGSLPPRPAPSAQRPSVRQLPGGPDDKSKPPEEKVSVLLIVGLGLIACIVGWMMAGWFS